MDKKDADKSFALGLHVPGTFYKVIDIKACRLHPDLGNQILDDVRSHIRNSNLPVYGLKSHQGFWRFVMLRNSVAYDRWMVNIITAFEDRTELQKIADDLMQKYPQIVSVINNITSKKAGVAIGEYEMTLAGADHLIDRIDSFKFMISANSFFQTNTRGAAVLYQKAKEYAELRGNESVLDLYSGTGAIAIFLSDSAGEIVGIEQVESAVKDAERNCAINQISNCRFICGDIRKRLPNIETRTDVMIIDPPRVGMHKDVVKQVLDMAPQKIVYVSCNPASLARDINMMKDRYHLLEVQPVDMFPHTHHVEVVAKLERKRSF
jgi:23S rRNA (uracil1939-C5)-methyltransferase